MVSACPSECDPREYVEEFVSDRKSKSLAGLREEGLEATVQVLVDELKKQRKDDNIILIDRDFLADNDIDFARDLEACLDKKVKGENDSLIFTYIPIQGWEKAATLCHDKGADVFYGVLACRQIPLITRIGLDR